MLAAAWLMFVRGCSHCAPRGCGGQGGTAAMGAVACRTSAMGFYTSFTLACCFATLHSIATRNRNHPQQTSTLHQNLSTTRARAQNSVCSATSVDRSRCWIFADGTLSELLPVICFHLRSERSSLGTRSHFALSVILIHLPLIPSLLPSSSSVPTGLHLSRTRVLRPFRAWRWCVISKRWFILPFVGLVVAPA